MRALASLIALFALLIAGCASPVGTVPRYATGAEALERMGRPTDIRRDPRGGEAWDYVTGPSGFQTWRLRIDPGGRVIETTQLVTEERLMSVVPGQSTKQDITELLGRPSEIEFVGTGEAWSWRTLVGGVEPGHLVVTFNPDGTARERMALRDPILDDDHDN